MENLYRKLYVKGYSIVEDIVGDYLCIAIYKGNTIILRICTKIVDNLFDARKKIFGSIKTIMREEFLEDGEKEQVQELIRKLKDYYRKKYFNMEVFSKLKQLGIIPLDLDISQIPSLNKETLEKIVDYIEKQIQKQNQEG